MGNVFRFEDLDGSIGLVTFDVPGQKLNTLSRAVLQELGGLVAQLEGRADLRGLLFRSGKPGQFIAGADLNELAALAFASREQVAGALTLGHQLFGRVERLPFPTVALIDGPCLGGGTELVLAMDERIASASPRTTIGLPEVQVGLLPAWGGTQRLPRLIGPHHAIEMITTGEPVSARKAAEVGLVFDAVPAERLVEEGSRLIETLRRGEAWEERRQRRRGPVDLGADALRFSFLVAEGAVRAKTKGQYPAPLLALKAIREGCGRPLDEALEVERAAALELVGSPTSANLIGVFFIRKRLGREPGADGSATAPMVNRVGVLGAGLMGAGIAAAHARSGIATVMVDVDEARLAGGLDRARSVVTGRIEIGRATPEDLAAMLGRLSTSTTPAAFADSDVVIEAIPEDEELKTRSYRRLGEILRDGAILASNTSTISIDRMARYAPHPGQFVGMHFFYPVDRMELVEVIRGGQTDDATVATIVGLAQRLRKTPIVVNDCPGFLVNRLLFPYMNEAMLLVREGARMDEVDGAATRFGMPMGPLALADLVGLDTLGRAAEVLIRAYPDRSSPSPILGELVRAGRLGKKSGSGFRTYAGKQGRPAEDPAVAPLLARHRTDARAPEGGEIADRLFLPMLLEATRVLEEGVVREPGEVDLGLILGVGFPAFRGGLLRWADAEGAGAILDRLARYAHLGKRFEPTESLERLARAGESFYPSPKGVIR